MSSPGIKPTSWSGWSAQCLTILAVDSPLSHSSHFTAICSVFGKIGATVKPNWCQYNAASALLFHAIALPVGWTMGASQPALGSLTTCDKCRRELAAGGIAAATGLTSAA